MTPTQVREFHVEFFWTSRSFEELSGIEQIRAMEAEQRSITEALASIDLHISKWNFPIGKRSTHKMIAWTYNMELSAASVRKALSDLEAFYVVSVRKTSRKLPILKHPRKPKPTSASPAFKVADYFEHIPQLSEAEQQAIWKRQEVEQLAIWKRQDDAERQRCQQRDQRGAGRARK